MSDGSPVKRSIPERIFEMTCTAILSGKYAPGEKLPTQRRLADEFGANMATVREAVKKLEQLRLIEVRHGDAMRVRDWRRHGSLDLVAHMLLSTGSFDREVFGNMLEARRLLLTESARLAAARSTERQLAGLAGLAQRLASEPDDDVAQALDFEFYEQLADASGNLVFALIMNSVRDLYLANAALFRAVVANREQLAPLYGMIAQAIGQNDGDAAARATLELIELQEARLLGLVANAAG